MRRIDAQAHWARNPAPRPTRIAARRLALVFLGTLVCIAPAPADPVYKWVDDSGRTRYSDRPPAGGQAQSLDIRVPSYTGPAEVSRVATAQTGVRIFTTAKCVYCSKAKDFLKKRGVSYTELDVEKDAAAKAEFKALGGRGVPVILVGDQRMDGFNAGRLEGLLKGAGL